MRLFMRTMKHLYFSLFSIIFLLGACNQSTPKKQEINIEKTTKSAAQQLLDKCLNKYDPNQDWDIFAAKVAVKTIIYRAQKNGKDTIQDERNSS